MAQPQLQIPPGAEAYDIQLLQAIKSGQDENDVEISLVLNQLNKGVAQLVAKNGKILTKIQGDVLKQINQAFVDDENEIDPVSTAMLSWTQSELNDVQLLLTQLAASAGLTNPGDPLEAALTQQLAEVPEMAYSASLFLALREAAKPLERIACSLESIAECLCRQAGEVPDEGTGEPDQVSNPPANAVKQPPVTWGEI